MNKYKIFLILLIIGNSLLGQNQRASILLKDGDILEGYGMITTFERIKFRSYEEEKSEIYTSRQVKEIIFFGFEESMTLEYVKINEKQKPVLLEVISYGRVNLYKQDYSVFMPIFDNRMIPGFQYSGRTFFVKRDNEKIATKFRRNLKKMAIKYFHDCYFIQEIIDSNEILKYSREEIVDDYNFYCPE